MMVLWVILAGVALAALGCFVWAWFHPTTLAYDHDDAVSGGWVY